ncbi:hypothetical protein VPHD81_0050 [Vibrio phage D81]
MNMLNMMAANAGMDAVEITIVRGSSEAKFVNGRYVKEERFIKEKKRVTLQAANPKEIEFISGGQRISDVRKFYINDGTTLNPKDGDKVEIFGELWTIVAVDNRPWHNYCKAMIVKEDSRKVKSNA